MKCWFVIIRTLVQLGSIYSKHEDWESWWFSIDYAKNTAFEHELTIIKKNGIPVVLSQDNNAQVRFDCRKVQCNNSVWYLSNQANMGLASPGVHIQPKISFSSGPANSHPPPLCCAKSSRTNFVIGKLLENDSIILFQTNNCFHSGNFSNFLKKTYLIFCKQDTSLGSLWANVDRTTAWQCPLLALAHANVGNPAKTLPLPQSHLPSSNVTPLTQLLKRILTLSAKKYKFKPV